MMVMTMKTMTITIIITIIIIIIDITVIIITIIINEKFVKLTFKASSICSFNILKSSCFFSSIASLAFCTRSVVWENVSYKKSLFTWKVKSALKLPLTRYFWQRFFSSFTFFEDYPLLFVLNSSSLLRQTNSRESKISIESVTSEKEIVYRKSSIKPPPPPPPGVSVLKTLCGGGGYLTGRAYSI